MHPDFPSDSADLYLIMTLAALLMLAIGILIGWAIGKNHRRAAWHHAKADYTRQITGWRNAYSDAVRRLRPSSRAQF